MRPGSLAPVDAVVVTLVVPASLGVKQGVVPRQTHLLLPIHLWPNLTQSPKMSDHSANYLHFPYTHSPNNPFSFFPAISSANAWNSAGVAICQR